VTSPTASDPEGGEDYRRRPSGGPPARSKRRRVPYWLSFLVIVLLLAGVTGAFVLWVLPSRFVFTSGLPSSGVSFPVAGTLFSTEDLVLVDPRPAPDPPVEAPEEDPAEAPLPEPGPAERLWSQVGPLMEAGEEEAAVSIFAAYLEDHPDDLDAWVEYGVALARSGQPREAEEAFQRVVRERDDRRALLEWAVLLRDREAWEPAAEIYMALLEDTPEDLPTRVELARTLAADQRLEMARDEYHTLLAQRPERHDLRLELAQVLWTADEPEAAIQVADQIPPDTQEHPAARAFTEQVELALAPPAEPEEVETDPLALAQVAIEEEDEEAVRAFYLADREAEELSPERALQWADLFQYRLDDPGTTIQLLEERATIQEPTAELRLRLARLYVWTGAETRARREIDRLLAVDEDHPEAWALLGDLQRWDGLRPAAADAYARALSLDPEESQALEGRESLTEETRRYVTSTEDPGVGITTSGFRDSEGFRVLDLAARGAILQRGALGASARTGYRSLRGERPDLSIGRDEGGFAELDLFRWWREGTVRAGLTLGVEHLQDGGTEHLFGAQFQAEQLGHWSVEGMYDRNRGYAVLSSIQSLDQQILADRVAIAIAGRPARSWSVSANAEVATLSGSVDRNWRMGAGASGYRDLTPTIRVGLTSRVLTFAEPAPVELEQRSYWDPELFWSSGIPVEFRTARHQGWNVYARVTPGAGLVRERDDTDAYWSAQLEGEGGIRYFGENASFNMNLFSMHGREGDYNASGLSLGMTLRR
jgi:tetratricopeptide (TPR) repeat protein